MGGGGSIFGHSVYITKITGLQCVVITTIITCTIAYFHIIIIIIIVK